jgi:4'-phosphopantetheinyl transferase
MLLKAESVDLKVYELVLEEKDLMYAPASDLIMLICSEEEKKRFYQFIHQPSALRFIYARVLLRWALTKYSISGSGKNLLLHASREWSLCFHQKGKPYLDPKHQSDLKFNLSHSGNRVVCVLAEGIEVGVDIERIDPFIDVDAMANQIMNIQERGQMKNCDLNKKIELFFDLWTLKEAYLKTIGEGLFYPIQLVNFIFNSTSHRFELQDRFSVNDVDVYQCTHVPCDTAYRLAIGWKGSFEIKRDHEILKLDTLLQDFLS